MFYLLRGEYIHQNVLFYILLLVALNKINPDLIGLFLETNLTLEIILDSYFSKFF
jgi:hypothetical protein